MSSEQKRFNGVQAIKIWQTVWMWDSCSAGVPTKINKSGATLTVATHSQYPTHNFGDPLVFYIFG